jgi:phosphoglycerol transferase MdoB-like AlkP superfamily enzyme
MIVVQCLSLTFALIVFGFTIFVLIKDALTKFETTLLIFIAALMINIIAYSTTLLFDYVDGSLISIQLYNWWSAFIRVQNIFTAAFIVWNVFTTMRQRLKLVEQITSDLDVAGNYYQKIQDKKVVSSIVSTIIDTVVSRVISSEAGKKDKNSDSGEDNSGRTIT